MSDNSDSPEHADDRLRGWKEIGAHLHTCDRTVQRWELSHHLPVHRIRTSRRSVVFASRRQLDTWVQSTEGQSAVSDRDDSSQPLSDGSVELSPVAVLGETITAPGCLDEQSRGPRHFALAAGVGLAVLALGSCVAAIVMNRAPGTLRLGGATPQMVSSRVPSTHPDPSGQRTSAARVLVAFANGSAGILYVPFGGVASTTGEDGTTYVVSAEHDPAGARIHLSRSADWDKGSARQLIEIGAWLLSPGQAIDVPGAGTVKSLQLDPPRPPTPAK